MARHEHRWGTELYISMRGGRRTLRRYVRYCVDGWCPLGKYRNGRVFMARPERNPRRMR